MDVTGIQNVAPQTSRSASAPRPIELSPKDELRGAATPKDPIASVFVQQDFPPNTRLHLDEESNRIVAQVLDENNEVIRQLPPQELLDISARFNRLEGIIFDEQR